jgi:hypothetical protein
LPTQLLTVPSFYKELNVFWPPAYYNDQNPLPECWLSMLTPANITEYVSALKNYPRNVVGSTETVRAEKTGAYPALTAKQLGPSPAETLQSSTQAEHQDAKPKFSEMLHESLRFDEIEGLEECIAFIKQQFDTMLQSTLAAALMARSVGVSSSHTRSTMIGGLKLNNFKFKPSSRLASLAISSQYTKLINTKGRNLKPSAGSRKGGSSPSEALEEGVDSGDEEGMISPPKNSMATKPSAVANRNSSFQKQSARNTTLNSINDSIEAVGDNDEDDDSGNRTSAAILLPGGGPGGNRGLIFSGKRNIRIDTRASYKNATDEVCMQRDDLDDDDDGDEDECDEGPNEILADRKENQVDFIKFVEVHSRPLSCFSFNTVIAGFVQRNSVV